MYDLFECAFWGAMVIAGAIVVGGALELVGMFFAWYYRD